MTRSKLELITECDKLGMNLDKVECEELSLSDRVIMSLRLGHITQDVNHLLRAMIYLIKGLNEDLNIDPEKTS